MDNNRIELPDYVEDLKDCWLIALTLVCVCLKRNYRVLSFNYTFLYKDLPDKGITLEDIVYKNLNMDLAGDNIDNFILSEDYLINELLNLNVAYYSLKNMTSQKRNIICNSIHKFMTVVWFDSYECPWNPMYHKKHVLHCATILKTEAGVCYMYDTLNKDKKFFSRELEDIINMCIYVFLFEEKVECDYITYTLDELFKRYLDGVVIKRNIANIIPQNIGAFYKDICNMKDRILMEEGLYDQQTIRLLMRLFENQQEKIGMQINVYKQLTHLPVEILELLEKIKCGWKMASVRFAKVCFLPNDKKQESYIAMCNYVEEILKDSELYYENLSELNRVVKWR